MLPQLVNENTIFTTFLKLMFHKSRRPSRCTTVNSSKHITVTIKGMLIAMLRLANRQINTNELVASFYGWQNFCGLNCR